MRPLHILLAVLVAAIWGFNFVVIKVGLRDFPPILFSGLRFLVAALPLLVLIGWKGGWKGGWKAGPTVAWRYVIGIGVVLGVVKFSLLFIGMDIGMPAGLSSLVLQAQAFFTVFYAALLLDERPTRRQALGMLVAFSGIGLIATEMPAGHSLLGLALVMAAAAAWGVSNIFMKLARPTDMVRLILWVSVVPPLPLFALSLAMEGPDRIVAALSGMTWLGVGAVLYISILSTLVAFAIWGFLLKTYTATLVAPFSLLVPVFGLSSAALLLGESLSAVKFAGAALVMAGLLLTIVKRVRPQTAAQTTA